MTAPVLYLVDGSSYLYRAFHALPPLSNSQGQPTGAVLGVVNMLVKFLKDYQPERIAVVFDAPGRTFRDDLFESYKAHRPPMPDELRAQIEPVLQTVAALGLPLLRMVGVEADDVIGTLARQATEQGLDVVISTGDKDMAQLVSPHVTCINTMTGSRLDLAGVKQKFDVEAGQIVDYLALVGDSADNIPGVPKVGPKTAAKWLGQYGTLDALVAHAGDIEGKVGESLREHLAELELSRRLATIDSHLSLDTTIADLCRRPQDNPTLAAIYRRLELGSLLRALPDADLPAAADAAVTAAATAAPTPPQRPEVSSRARNVSPETSLELFVSSSASEHASPETPTP